MGAPSLNDIQHILQHSPESQPVPTGKLKRTIAMAVIGLMLAITASRLSAQGYSATVCAKGEGGITLAVQDQFITLKGGICPGDDKKLQAFLTTVDPSIRTIKLASGGGNGEAAQAIGVMIRDGQYNTLVDASKNKCASACTHIFASGTRRYYVGGTDFVTGLEAARGLGYHYPNARHTDETDADKDKGFNAMTVPYLNRMLPPDAAKAVVALMSGNRTTKVTWLNGDDALRTGIATALVLPP